MKKISILFGLFLIIFSTGSLRSQEAVSSTNSEKYATTGTFQYVFKSQSMEKEVILNDSDLAAIANYRHAEKEIFIRFDENILIKILPKSVIYAPGFNPSATVENLYYVEMNMNQYSDIYKQAINFK